MVAPVGHEGGHQREERPQNYGATDNKAKGDYMKQAGMKKTQHKTLKNVKYQERKR